MLDYPQVELDFMNRDHAEFVALVDTALAALINQHNQAEIDHLLDHLLEHTRRHFAEENRLMEEFGFPPMPVHQGEHERTLADMSARIESWKRERDTGQLKAWLGTGLPDWFVNHVRTMDFMTALFIKTAQSQH